MTRFSADSSRWPTGAMGDQRPPRDSPPLLIGARDAARLLSISERRLWDLEKTGAVPSRRIGRLVRYSPAELEAWIALGCPTEAGAADAIRTSLDGSAR